MEPNYELTDDHAASHLTDKQRLAVDCIVQGFTGQEVAKEIRTARETVCMRRNIALALKAGNVRVALEFVKRVDSSGCH